MKQWARGGPANDNENSDREGPDGAGCVGDAMRANTEKPVQARMIAVSAGVGLVRILAPHKYISCVCTPLQTGVKTPRSNSECQPNRRSTISGPELRMKCLCPGLRSISGRGRSNGAGRGRGRWERGRRSLPCEPARQRYDPEPVAVAASPEAEQLPNRVF